MTLAEYVKELEQECEKYRRAALSYGVDADGMVMLAKSQIRTAANNIHLMDELEFYYDLADGHIPSWLMPKDVYNVEKYVERLIFEKCDAETRDDITPIVLAAFDVLYELVKKSAKKKE